MRNRIEQDGLTVNAVAGTHVVILGLDLSDKKRKGCLGFAIQREDLTEKETYWMLGQKVFEATNPKLGLGGQASSRQHPFQSFQWSDYTAKPQHQYVYTIIPLYGKPAALIEGSSLSIPISTEPEFSSVHSVFFNRAVIASQEYARRFQNVPPDELTGDDKEAAYAWLSRGLLEAFKTFVRRANGKRFSIYGAMYQFQWADALDTLREVAATGAKVQVIYDAIPGKTGPKEENEGSIAEAKIKGISIPHTQGKIMHNKFFILTEDDVPIAVFGGSTNLTENGIFGHLNCGHLVEDPNVAAKYLEYWKQLKSDDALGDDRSWVGENDPIPPDPWKENLTLVFSPRSGLAPLDWYAEIASGATNGLFMTFAFGMDKRFKAFYEKNDGILKFALMEKEGNGSAAAQGKIDIARIRKLPNVVVALGRNITTNSFDSWLKEAHGLTEKTQVHWIHTKFMLVDPLGSQPIVVTGSANFSEASTNSNHENMLVIRNDTRVADIYLGEFMRMFSHYAFREAVARAKAGGDTDWKPNFLLPDDSWQGDYFKAGSERYLRRHYFAA